MISTRRQTVAATVHSIELPVDPRSAGRARRFATDTLCGWGLDDLADATILLTSEVVTNALLHAGSDRICLRLRRLTGGVRVEVDDQSRLLPQQRRADQLAESGRGMGLVQQGARAWGTQHTGQGKTVWFEVATP